MAKARANQQDRKGTTKMASERTQHYEKSSMKWNKDRTVSSGQIIIATTACQERKTAIEHIPSWEYGKGDAIKAACQERGPNLNRSPGNTTTESPSKFWEG